MPFLLLLAAGLLPAQILLRPDPLSVANLSIPDSTRTLLRSGYDYNDGNCDSGNLIRVEPAGAAFTDPASEWVVFDATGPGALTSIWLTGKNRKGGVYIGGKLNFYFDGETNPSFSAFLPDALVATSGGWVSYTPVIFARSLKITLSGHGDSYTHRQNARGEEIPHLYHQFTYQRFQQPVRSMRPTDLKNASWMPDVHGRITHGRMALPPGKSVVVFESSGMGILNELRLRWIGPAANESRIRIVADGAVSVDLKVPEMWGFSRTARSAARMQSLLLGVEDDGTYYVRFPMPHRNSLRIEIENSGQSGSLQVTARHLEGWPEKEHFYFRANRVTDVTEPGRDIRLLETTGRGHYVGAVLELADGAMEGDDRFYVDGESFPPAWHGTGTEDYFRCGWNFHGGPLTRPVYGMLDSGKPKIAYRFHVADRVNFTRSVIIGFEHGHANDYLGPYKGTVFWYSERASDPPPPASPQGERADLAEFGRQSSGAVEWDEPRQFDEVRAVGAPSGSRVEYWVSSWPPVEGRGGWTVTDSPFNGEWRAIHAFANTDNGVTVFRFAPLSQEENPNAKRQPDYKPRYRRALKVRVRGARSIEVYGDARWTVSQVRLSGDDVAAASVYAGRMLSRDPLRLAWIPGAVLSVRSGNVVFGVAMDDLVRQRSVYVEDAKAFISTGETFDDYVASARHRPGRDILSQVAKRPEQSLERATAEIPALNFTNRNPYRYVPVGFFGNREKYGVLFNGNIFVSKRFSKAFADEQKRMQWEGDTITWKIGTGLKPDFRERERAATQHMLDGYLPVVITQWRDGAIHYREETFATLIDAPLDPWRNRGDETSLLLIRLEATNTGNVEAPAQVLFDVSPGGALTLANGRLTEGDKLRALLPRDFVMRNGRALTSRNLAPGASSRFEFRLAFRTLTDASAIARAEAVDYDHERARVLEYWRGVDRLGMKLHVPDEAFNTFYRAVLQHVLLSVERDVGSGLYMAPCGTYRYNMFANETALQTRLLDMRGIHDLAARFLQPFVTLQGSKPMPGNFKTTGAMYHGVRVDAQHDYTHAGYNLDHGWMLWTLAEHYMLSHDRAWLQANMTSMLKAANWIISERQATMQVSADGRRTWEFGLLPAGQMEDNEEWHYWFAVNGYAYKGLLAAATAIADVNPQEGKRLAAEAAAYREDIRAAVKRSIAAMPVAGLRDGTAVPVLAPRTGLHARELGWIRNILYGALSLVDTGVLASEEAWTTWTLRDAEDNLFMSPMSFSTPESEWFSRGGITLQPNLVNTPMTYLARGQVPNALRAFYNTFAASYYPDVNAFTEWLPAFGHSEGPFYKTSDESAFLTWLRMLLVREDGDTLLLASGAPRRWFEPGERIEVEGAATYFGPVSFRVDSSEHAIEAEVRMPEGFRAKRVLLRLPGDGPLLEVPTAPGIHKIRVDR